MSFKMRDIVSIGSLAMLFLWPAVLTGESTYDYSSCCCCGRPKVLTVRPIPTLDSGIFIDVRDGKKYKTVTINSQTWMAENLNFDTADGNGSWCYDNNSTNCEIYGRLYNWNTAMAGAAGSKANPSGVRGVCPEGWHLPSSAEWDTLINVADLWVSASTKLKSLTYWKPHSNTLAGIDEYGFSALPGGCRSCSHPTDSTHYLLSPFYFAGPISTHYLPSSFYFAGTIGYWWSATDTKFKTDEAEYWFMQHSNESVRPYLACKDTYYSIRCLKNN